MEFSKRKRGSISSRAESRVKFWQKELLQQSLYGSPNGEMRMATGRWMGKNRGGEIDSSSTYFTKVCVCMYVCSSHGRQSLFFLAQQRRFKGTCIIAAIYRVSKNICRYFVCTWFLEMKKLNTKTTTVQGFIFKYIIDLS